ncbi:hypothetical protein [Carnobacterium divergens]|uniref:Uncharacterized protein n=1 Tax=Carnobacterium divergens TaxID=2748 RepID=A0AAW8REM0_CARDV|nr:hypothetical protein [Carnobacterium divergens]MDT1958966.1 hypothetical protein [Carnobacterium divergens]MDT1974934.1 hypothetical protein [Carnobacterium divergens]MDT2012898.1 hypothetical protein [Carnobacterium divergens]
MRKLILKLKLFFNREVTGKEFVELNYKKLTKPLEEIEFLKKEKRYEEKGSFVLQNGKVSIISEMSEHVFLKMTENSNTKEENSND